jgi:hypothetical protein
VIRINPKIKRLLGLSIFCLCLIAVYAVYRPRYIKEEMTAVSYTGREYDVTLDLQIRRRVNLSTRLHRSLTFDGIQYISINDVRGAGGNTVNGIVEDNPAVMAALFIPARHRDKIGFELADVIVTEQLWLIHGGTRIRPNLESISIITESLTLYAPSREAFYSSMGE